ncbi:MAG: hypothetical protein C4318_08040 [Acidimicrobiia bacterium]
MALQRLGIDLEDEVVLTCASGNRAMTAASILEAKGFSRVAVLEGGVSGLKEKRASFFIV